MAYEKAAVRLARELREGREQRERDDRAQVAQVVAEFDGDAARMAEEILYWRRRIERLVEVVTKFESREPFILMGGQGLHGAWRADHRRQYRAGADAAEQS
jgi:hypothetical protein